MNSSNLMMAIAAGMLIAAAPAKAHYPERPIRVVVGFPPGGPADTVARLIGQPMSQGLGKMVVIENIAGAAGTIAATRVAKAPPDGYTLAVMTEAQMLINPTLYHLSRETGRDVAPISQLAVAPYLLIVPSAFPAKSVRELVAAAKAQPSMLTFASPGTGTTPHMAAELFKIIAAIDVRHVPYKGVGPAVPDLLAGRVTMMFSPMATALPFVREGKLRALAVTSVRRSPASSEFPTIADAGYRDFDVTGWLALVAPAHTPATVIRTLQVEAASALALPDVRAKLANLGFEPIASSPDELTSIVKTGVERWAKVIRDAGIRVE